MNNKLIDQIVEALSNEDEKAYEHLYRFGIIEEIGFEQAIEPMRQILANPVYPPYIRATCAIYLGKLEDQDSLELLIGILRDKDENETVRSYAASGLGYLKNTKAFEVLVEALQEDRLETASTQALGKLGDLRAIEILITVLKKPGENRWWPQTCAQRALTDLGYENVFDVFLELLKDENPKVRIQAADGLMWSLDKRAVEPLIEIVKHDQDSRVRSAAIRYLVWWKELHDKRSIPPMIEALQEGDDLVKIAAAWSLMHIGDERAIQPLIEATKHQNPEVRYWACFALGNIGDEKVLPTLEFIAANDKGAMSDWEFVAKSAQDAIERIKQRSILKN